MVRIRRCELFGERRDPIDPWIYCGISVGKRAAVRPAVHVACVAVAGSVRFRAGSTTGAEVLLVARAATRPAPATLAAA